MSIVAVGLRGQRWAVAVSAAMGALVVLALVHAMSFGVLWLLSVITGRGRS
jgi:hypothetical protein